MKTKLELQRGCRLRYFIRSVINDAVTIDHILAVDDDVDAMFAKVMIRVHALDWTDVTETYMACAKVREWLTRLQVAIICWVPDAGGFVNSSNWFDLHLESLMKQSGVNLLLTTTDLNHGIHVLKCEHSIGTKSW